MDVVLQKTKVIPFRDGSRYIPRSLVLVKIVLQAFQHFRGLVIFLQPDIDTMALQLIFQILESSAKSSLIFALCKINNAEVHLAELTK